MFTQTSNKAYEEIFRKLSPPIHRKNKNQPTLTRG